MKFTEGYWKNKENINIYNASEVYNGKLNKDSIELYVPHFNIQNRGQTLCGPLLTVCISSPMKDVISVKIVHFKGRSNNESLFEINKEKPELNLSENDDRWSIKSGSLEAHIMKGKEWKIKFSNEKGELTSNGWRTTAYIKDGDNQGYIREQLGVSVGELLYGLGERFTPFVRNGQNIDIWNEDGGTCSEKAYKNIPFYISNKGYGVFVNNSGKVSYEVCSENVSRVQFSVKSESMEYFIINGPNIKDVLYKYACLTGFPSLPPVWSFGLWLSTSFITDYSEKVVSEFIRGMKDRDLPLHVFHFDCFWMKEYTWMSFKWDKKVFPAPEAMLKNLKSLGLKICVWINPYIAQQSDVFDECVENHYLIKMKNGDVWQCDDWQPGMGIVDFTNPAAYNWFKEKIKELAGMGVDTIKTDFGERIPLDVEYYDKSNPEMMHNYYTYLYNKAVFEALKEENISEDVVLFARSATAGCQKFPVHWGGDCSATYESMAESLRGGLSLCMSGFGFWSHDIAGFENTATPDLYKRWVAFGLLSSHSRLHGNMSYRVPWLFDDESVDVLRHFTKVKCKLMPYIYNISIEASQCGYPVMRAMIIEFQDDMNCLYLDRQYMLGDSILVAPIFSESGNVSYYLPEGVWTNYFTNKKVIGGKWIHENYDYFGLPLMVKDNSILPIGKDSNNVDYDYFDEIEINIFELNEKIEIKKNIYNNDKTSSMEIVVSMDDNNLRIKVNTDKKWSIVYRNDLNIKSIKNGKYSKVKNGVKITPENINSEIILDIFCKKTLV